MMQGTPLSVDLSTQHIPHIAITLIHSNLSSIVSLRRYRSPHQCDYIQYHWFIRRSRNKKCKQARGGWCSCFIGAWKNEDRKTRICPRQDRRRGYCAGVSSGTNELCHRRELPPCRLKYREYYWICHPHQGNNSWDYTYSCQRLTGTRRRSFQAPFQKLCSRGRVWLFVWGGFLASSI